MPYKQKKASSFGKSTNFSRGITFIEALIGVSVFLVVSISAYGAYTSVMELVRLSRYKIAAADLANEQFEIARNLPYASVGIVGGIPSGLIPYTQTVTRDKAVFTVVSTVRNIDQPFDGTFGGVPNDLSPADNKLMEVSIDCTSCVNFPTLVFTALIAPKNLEQASSNGALFVRVFDANGMPVQFASVHIENNATSTPIVVDDVTNAQGLLQLVDVPPGVDAYEVTVSKSGYSTDKTEAVSAGNPNPSKPHATVAAGSVTQLSFAIDRVSTATFSSVTDTCVPVGSINFQMTGSKLVGTNPLIPKYDEALSTNTSGQLSLSNIEWDTYTVLGTDTAYDVIGLNPLNPISINPNATLNIQMVVAAKDPQRLIVTVKDAVTLLPVSEATVLLQSGSVNLSKVTGRGYLGQTDWSGAAGQVVFTDPSRYFSSDGNLDRDVPAGELKLHEVIGSGFLSNGWLESSTFDTGSLSRFYNLIWQPLAQPPDTGADSVSLQASANNDGETWNFTGPDGTAGTFYTLANQNLSQMLNDNRYFRYKVFLSTASTSFTPVVSDINFTFNSSCTPAGQVEFSALSNDDYTVTVSKTGYQDSVVVVPVSSSWQEEEVLLVPN